MIMEKLEEQIQIEYYRLAGELGVYPSYLHVHPSFVKELSIRYFNGSIHYNVTIDEKEHNFKYMGMTIKRSLDINEDEFLLSFDKYQLQ